MKKAWIFPVALLILVVGAIFIDYAPSREIPDPVPTSPPSTEFSVGMVSGTEYMFAEDGQVIVEVRNAKSEPLSASCTASIWYPDKSSFIAAQAMNTSASGNYYIAFPIPYVQGVYEYQANCTVLAKSRIVSKSFHVSQPPIRAVIPK